MVHRRPRRRKPGAGRKPKLGPDDRLFEVYQASVGVTGKYGDFSVHVNPRFRDTKVREFYTSNVWLQQAYGAYQTSGVKVSAGKIENQLSVLDDDSFYLNLPYFDGIKYESDYGLSVEGAHDLSEAWSLHYTGQYFVTDGHTNGSLRDRDTVWVDGGHRRHIAVARVDPGYRFSPTTSLRFGVAAQVAAVDLGSGANDPVLRLDGDFSFVTGPVRLFGEAIFQLGQTVTRYPLEAKGNLSSRASSRNLYAIAGAIQNRTNTTIEVTLPPLLPDNEPRTATVTCETDCTFLLLSQRTFLGVVDQVPALAHKLLASLASRIRDLDRQYFG